MTDEYLAGTIYFGGGTPTMLKVEHFADILQTLKKHFRWTENIEITTEANPQNIHVQYLRDLHSAGINRISFGMQSALPGELEILGRRHQFQDIVASVEWARSAGFQNISLDLIFGIPTQIISTWKKSLEEAVRLEPNHLSLYSLILEETTPLYRAVRAGRFPQVDSDLDADMYSYAMDFLGEMGFGQYEISNWAFGEDSQCKHNIQYWRNGPYLGFGAGAHSHYNHRRWRNISKISEYIHQSMENDKGIPPAVEDLQKLKKMDEIRETIIMGMRLTNEGIDIDSFFHRFGSYVHDIFGKEINRLLAQELIEEYHSSNRKGIRLTRRGRMVGNQVFMQFVE